MYNTLGGKRECKKKGGQKEGQKEGGLDHTEAEVMSEGGIYTFPHSPGFPASAAQLDASIPSAAQ